MSATVRALEEDIFLLSERVPDKQSALDKQRLYSRVGQFLVGSFDGHWWCQYPTLMTFMVRILELHPGPESVRVFYDKMAFQLGLCQKCVDIYHSALPSVRAELENEFTPASVKDFFHKVSQLDADRISKQFVPRALASSSATHNAVISTAIYEVLTHRRLWSDFRIIRVISKWLSSTSEPEKEAVIDKETILRRCPGILQWLVCPDSTIRAWATSLVAKHGIADLAVETADGREWMKVLDEWMYILESGSFNASLLNLDLPSTEELPVFLEVTNCVKTPTNQILWAALDTIMQRMNPNSLEALLESFDNLPDLVFNYLNDAEPATTNPQITFVICKCYGSLMRCLGHRYWNHTVHSPKVVLDLILQHCLLPSWRVFVTKQLIELLPPLISSMRPPSSSTNEKNASRIASYFEARKRVLMLLLHHDQRPSHFNDQVLCVAASKAVSTIICDCYEPRLSSSTSTPASVTEPVKRDDGALPEMSLVDLSVVQSSFWWPCGPSFGDIEQLWINHLFLLLVNPENVVSLVDHVALTCSTVLLKHLSLAREVVYTSIIEADRSKALSSLLPSKPIITRLLERLCSWKVVATIPIAVHGALFESIGGIAELTNVIAGQNEPVTAIEEFKATLKEYEALVAVGYLERISEEVLVKGLTNPIQFPVVAQHLTVCLLSPNPQVDHKMKRLLAQAGANKAKPERVPSPLESLLVVVHRSTEAIIRGIHNLLQAWKLHGYALQIVLPTVKKLIFPWTKMFEMLGKDLKKAMDASIEISSQETSNSVNLQKVPVLIGDFMVQLLSDLYGGTRPMTVEEPVLIQCLDFGNAFWRFFTKEDKPAASSKRFEGMVTPLSRCVESVGGQAEKRRAAELLMTLLESFVEGQTRIADASITRLEAIKASNVESKKSTDFPRMAKKLRQVSKASRFFSPRPIKKSQRSASVLDLTGGDSDPTATIDYNVSSLATGGSNRPMSAKGAAREQARLAAARSAASAIFVPSSKKAHSFYDEDDFAVARPTSTTQSSVLKDGKTKTFDISQVIQGLEKTHPGARRVRNQESATGSVKELVEQQKEDEEEKDDSMNLAPLFYKIKNTQKPIPSSSLLPFFRHLLQVCMPSLLTREFENERSDRELLPPPLTFAKSSEYANAFLPLLLEECHNEVQEGLRRCYHSAGRNNGHLMRYESEKPREGMRCLSFSVVESNTSLPGKSRPGGGFFRREKLFHNADVVLLRSVGSRQNAGNINLIGVILVSNNDKGKRRQGGPGVQGGPGGAKGAPGKDDQELVRVLFLNDGELESVTSEIPSFQMEAVAANAIADTEWRVTTLGNLVTSSREYIALRSVDMLPDHFRSTILTPNLYESTQTELLKIADVLDELRGTKSDKHDAERKILKLLKRLDKMEVTLTDLRSTSIGKAVNKVRKHENSAIKDLSTQLKDKWTALMDKKDALDVAPRFVAPELWDAIKEQYNQSQLQSIHSVLNNYRAAISLLQGPPGTGKTKTIMGLLSGFLSLKLPPSLRNLQPLKAIESSFVEKSSEAAKAEKSTDGAFNNFDLVREMATRQGSGRAAPATFSLNGTAAASRILRHSDADARPKATAMQALRNTGSVRSRLESKISGNRPASADVVRRTLLGPSVLSVRPRAASSKTANVLLCAPSNGAVDELVLRIVTDGLVDRSGNVTKVRAPSVHPDANVDGFTIVRLGNPGEDAPDVVKVVCLPHIIKQELAIHPKNIELRALQDQQRTLRGSIREFHDKKNEEKAAGSDDKAANRSGRKGLAKTHAELTQISGRVRRLRNEVSQLETKMTAALLSSASIIACTLSKAGSGQFEGLQRGFDALIVDEAAQAVELSTLIPMRERVARAVLVGDPKQLPATVKSVVAAKARYDRSLFERIADSGVAPSMLRVQYRMHPFLREFPSKRFYGGMLADGPTVMERVQRVCGDLYKHPYFQPFLLYDLVDTRESDSNGSKFNVSEAAFCVDLCSSLFSICPELSAKKWSVGFVSPYKEQVGVLRKEINRSSTLPLSVSVEVNTVDGFQGREKDVIIFSCVRASDRGGIGFLKDIRRLNVGITRARFCLFVVGSARTLRRDETWRALLESAQERKLVIQAKASAGFAAVKEELDRDSRGLKAHYAEMHDKLINKKVTVAPAKPQLTAPGDLNGSSHAEEPIKQKSPSKQVTPVKEESVEVDIDEDIRTGTHPSKETRIENDGKSEAPSPTSKQVAGVKREHAGVIPSNQPPEKKVKAEPSNQSSTVASSHSAVTTPPTSERTSIEATRAPLSSFTARSSSRDRSRSRGRDNRSRFPSSDRERSGGQNSFFSSSSNGLKRPPTSSERDFGSSKTSKISRDEHHRSRSRERPSSETRRDYHRRRSRSRSRSRERPPSATRRQDAKVNAQQLGDRTFARSHIARSPRDLNGNSNGQSPGAGGTRELERTAAQKHEERQARLRALRDGSNAKVAASMQRGSVNGSGRIVQLVRGGSREPSVASTASSGSSRTGGGLLGSILGSTKQLAKSTARVDPTNARRDHTS